MQQTIGKYRWTICALVFFATTINYLDRQVISLVVEDYLIPEFGWSETDYAISRQCSSWPMRLDVRCGKIDR